MRTKNLCPRCRYDLGGLEYKPCPECGLDLEGIDKNFTAQRTAQTTALCLSIIPGVIIIPLALAGHLFRSFGGFLVAVAASVGFILFPIYVVLHLGIVLWASRILEVQLKKRVVITYLILTIASDLIMFSLIWNLFRFHWVD